MASNTGNKKQPARLYAEKLCRKFPNAPTRQLATIAWAEAQELFTSYEHARSTIRTTRGNNGKDQRRDCDPTLFRANDRNGSNWKDLLPKPRERKTWAPLRLKGPFRTLVMGDLHVPFHSLEPVTLAMEEGLKRKCDVVLLNGDFIDNHAISRWETDPRERDFAGELDATRQLLGSIRRAFPKARIIFKWGNHDERWDAYMRLKAPELLDVPEFQLESMLRLTELNIESVKDCRPIFLGKLPTLHGHEYKYGISAPVNAARGLYLRAKTHALCNHVHTTSNHTESDLNGHTTTTFSVACLCDLRPDYARLNKWNNGCAVVEVDSKDGFDVSNYRFANGKLWR